jgi:hypothetical protein
MGLLWGYCVCSPSGTWGLRVGLPPEDGYWPNSHAPGHPPNGAMSAHGTKEKFTQRVA